MPTIIDTQELADRVRKLETAESAYKETIRQLRLEAQRFQNLYNETPFGYQSLDSEGRIIEVNQAWLDLLGYARSDVIGRWFGEFLPPNEVARYKKRFQIFIASGEMHADVRMHRHDGSEIFVHVDGRVAKDAQGNFKQTHSFLHDITRRRRVEAAFKESQRKLATELKVLKRLQHIGSLFVGDKNLPEVMEEIVETAIFITKADMGNLQLYDPSSEYLTIVAHRGFDKAWLDFWASVRVDHGACGKAIRETSRVIVEDVTQSDIFVGTPALTVQLAAGIRAVLSTPLIGRSGNLLGIISTHFKAPHRPTEVTLRQLDLLARQATDIIEHAQAEEETKKLEALLHQSQKMESIGNLAGGIAHDFNNILSVILGYTELALDEAPKDAFLEDSLKEVYSAGGVCPNPGIGYRRGDRA